MPPAIGSQKIMFEIYRETPREGRYRVVYFTELDEHNKEKEINDAMRGDHVFDGFIRNHGKEEAKRAVTQILDRLNQGENLTPAEIASALQPFMA
jgi:hypothetical protein